MSPGWPFRATSNAAWDPARRAPATMGWADTSASSSLLLVQARACPDGSNREKLDLRPADDERHRGCFERGAFDEKEPAGGVLSGVDWCTGIVTPVPLCGELELLEGPEALDERDGRDDLVLQAMPDDFAVVAGDDYVECRRSPTHVDVDCVRRGVRYPERDRCRFSRSYPIGEYEQEIECVAAT